MGIRGISWDYVAVKKLGPILPKRFVRQQINAINGG
jgi:hypothetical protein